MATSSCALPESEGGTIESSPRSCSRPRMCRTARFAARERTCHSPPTIWPSQGEPSNPEPPVPLRPTPPVPGAPHGTWSRSSASSRSPRLVNDAGQAEQSKAAGKRRVRRSGPRV
eukprot:scaffold16223_cov27-Tisochrysis_lutea.AAC.2